VELVQHDDFAELP